MNEWGLSGGITVVAETDGSIRASDGRLFRPSPERVKASNGRAAVEAGSPIVTDIYPNGSYLFEGEAAVLAWRRILPKLVVGKPPRVHNLQWIGHLWAADDGSRLLYFEGSH